MDRRHRHTYNTGVKVSGFFTDHREQFPDDSHATPFIRKVDDGKTVIAGQFARQVRAWGRLQAAHMSVRASTAGNVRDLLTGLQHLDVIVRNQFRGDKKTLDAWKTARHIETGPIPAAPGEPENPAAASTAPATKTA